MTMKRLSRKQIIIPMNNKNKTQFMKEFSTHIANINRALKTSNQKSLQTLYNWKIQVL